MRCGVAKASTGRPLSSYVAGTTSRRSVLPGGGDRQSVQLGPGSPPASRPSDGGAAQRRGRWQDEGMGSAPPRSDLVLHVNAEPRALSLDNRTSLLDALR